MNLKLKLLTLNYLNWSLLIIYKNGECKKTKQKAEQKLTAYQVLNIHYLIFQNEDSQQSGADVPLVEQFTGVGIKVEDFLFLLLTLVNVIKFCNKNI